MHCLGTIAKPPTFAEKQRDGRIGTLAAQKAGNRPAQRHDGWAMMPGRTNARSMIATGEPRLHKPTI